MRKRLIVIICTDTASCYNRAVYPFASLCTQYFRLEVFYLLVLLRTIEIKKILLYILFRVLDMY